MKIRALPLVQGGRVFFRISPGANQCDERGQISHLGRGLARRTFYSHCLQKSTDSAQEPL